MSSEGRTASTTHAERPIDIALVLRAQYKAGLAMLRETIGLYPEPLWLSGEGHAAPSWRIAVHALFYTHFYLQKDQHSMELWPG